MMPDYLLFLMTLRKCLFGILKKKPQQSEALKFQGKECIYKMIEIVNSGTH